MRDPSGRSRCFGFVSFADSMVVDIVLQKTHILDKKQIDPKRAVPKEQQSSHRPSPSSIAPSRDKDENKVFVGGIHIEADELDLKEAFSQFGKVMEAILMKDRETGRSRGFGFVTFASHEGVEKACSANDLRIRDRRVEVKLAVPKGRGSYSGSTGASNTPGYGSSHSSSAADPYAAWSEYFRQQYPEYYEAMMNAYNNPNAMAAYYNQFYNGNTAPGTTSPAHDNDFGIQERDLHSAIENPPRSGHSEMPPYYYIPQTDSSLPLPTDSGRVQHRDYSEPYASSRNTDDISDTPHYPDEASLERRSHAPQTRYRNRSRSRESRPGRYNRSPRTKRGRSRSPGRRSNPPRAWVGGGRVPTHDENSAWERKTEVETNDPTKYHGYGDIDYYYSGQPPTR